MSLKPEDDPFADDYEVEEDDAEDTPIAGQYYSPDETEVEDDEWDDSRHCG